jgi:hypothetical protein
VDHPKKRVPDLLRPVGHLVAAQLTDSLSDVDSVGRERSRRWAMVRALLVAGTKMPSNHAAWHQG